MTASAPTPTITRACPQCQTRFLITREQASVAEGMVRCGACLTVFDCREVAIGPAPAPPPVTRLLDAPASAAESQRGPVPAKAETGSAASPPEPALDSRPRVVAPQPLAARNSETKPASRRRWTNVGRPAMAYAATFACLGSTFAALVLAIQFPVWSDEPATHAIYETACSVLPCTLQPVRALERIGLMAPQVERAAISSDLHVRFNLVNRANFAQPLPDVGLRLLTADGDLIEERRFTPDQYRPDGTQDMTVDATVEVSVTLDDVNEGATMYAVSLL